MAYLHGIEFKRASRMPWGEGLLAGSFETADLPL